MQLGRAIAHLSTGWVGIHQGTQHCLGTGQHVRGHSGTYVTCIFTDMRHCTEREGALWKTSLL